MKHLQISVLFNSVSVGVWVGLEALGVDAIPRGQSRGQRRGAERRAGWAGDDGKPKADVRPSANRVCFDRNESIKLEDLDVFHRKLNDVKNIYVSGLE